MKCPALGFLLYNVRFLDYIRNYNISSDKMMSQYSFLRNHR